MKSLLYLPTWVSFLIVIGISTALSLIGVKFTRKRFAAERLKENHDQS